MYLGKQGIQELACSLVISDWGSFCVGFPEQKLAGPLTWKCKCRPKLLFSFKHKRPLYLGHQFKNPIYRKAALQYFAGLWCTNREEEDSQKNPSLGLSFVWKTG